MSKLLDFIARHAVISTTAFAILLILRYGLAIANIGGGLFLLIRNLLRAAQK